MAPKAQTPFRQLSHKEQEERLLQRGREMKRKRLRNAINLCLDTHENAAQDVSDYLVSLGYMPKQGSTPTKKSKSQVKEEEEEEHMSPKQTVGVKLANVKQEVEKGSSVVADHRVRTTAGISDSNPDNWIPHKYTIFSNSSIIFLKSALSQVEEVALSDVALRPLVVKGTLQQKTDRLCDYVEWTTGMSRDMAFTGSMRHIPTLISEMKGRNVLRGRRARDRRVPVDFPACGIFAMRDKEGELWVFLNDNDAITSLVPDSLRLRYADGTYVPIESLRIESNFNEKTASIVADENKGTIDISSLGKWFDFEASLMPAEALRRSPSRGPQVEQAQKAKCGGELGSQSSGRQAKGEALPASRERPNQGECGVSMAAPVCHFDERDWKPTEPAAAQGVKEEQKQGHGHQDPPSDLQSAKPEGGESSPHLAEGGGDEQSEAIEDAYMHFGDGGPSAQVAALKRELSGEVEDMSEAATSS